MLATTDVQPIDPSRSLRETGPGSVILRERQQ
jgi:hypothetical protein